MKNGSDLNLGMFVEISIFYDISDSWLLYLIYWIVASFVLDDMTEKPATAMLC